MRNENITRSQHATRTGDIMRGGDITRSKESGCCVAGMRCAGDITHSWGFPWTGNITRSLWCVVVTSRVEGILRVVEAVLMPVGMTHKMVGAVGILRILGMLRIDRISGATRMLLVVGIVRLFGVTVVGILRAICTYAWYES